MRVLLISITVIFSILLGVYVFFVESLEDGFIMNFGRRVYDPVGEIKDISNRFFRNCEEVTTVPLRSTESVAITNHLRNLQMGEPGLTSVIKSGKWFIVESGFDKAESGIFMLQETEHGYITHSEWSGTSAPFNDGPVLREYFSSNAPEAPYSLIACFERGNGR